MESGFIFGGGKVVSTYPPQIVTSYRRFYSPGVRSDEISIQSIME